MTGRFNINKTYGFQYRGYCSGAGRLHVTRACIRWKKRCVKNVERNWKRPEARHKDRCARRGRGACEKMRRVCNGGIWVWRKKSGKYLLDLVEFSCSTEPPANVGKAGSRLKSNPAACGLIKGFAEFRLFLLLRSSWLRESRFYILQYRRRLNWKTRLPFSFVSFD